MKKITKYPGAAVDERRGTQIQMNLTRVPQHLSTAAPQHAAAVASPVKILPQFESF